MKEIQKEVLRLTHQDNSLSFSEHLQKDYIVTITRSNLQLPVLATEIFEGKDKLY